MATATENEKTNHTASHHDDLVTHKVCCHCDTKGDYVSYYCTNCKLHICEVCIKKHRKFPDMRSHQVIARVEALKSCVEDHYTDETEHLENTLKEKLCDLKGARERLVNQKRELAKVAKQLQLEDTDVQPLPSDIMQKSIKEKRRILKTLHTGQVFDDCLTGYKKFLQESTNKAQQTKERMAEVMTRNQKSLDEMNHFLHQNRGAVATVGSESPENKEQSEKGKVQPAGRIFPKMECNVCHPISVCCIIILIVAIFLGYNTMNHHESVNHRDTVVFSRESKVSLVKLAPEYQQEVTQFQSECSRLTFHKNNLWCVSTQDNCIDVYSVADLSMDIITYEEDINPRSLQPLTSDQMVLAASSGLYLTNSIDGSVYTKLRDSLAYDVHVTQDIIVALLLVGSNTEVHIFNKTEPPTLFNNFPIKADHTQSLLLHDQHIYITAWGQSTTILKYTLKGKLVAQYGSKGDGGPGEMLVPRLCAVDSDGNLFIADTGNDRFQVLSSLGKFSVVNGLYLEQPYDAVITGETMFVLHVSRDNKRRVVQYKI